METKDIEEKFKDPQPWHPITNSVDLKHLGKLIEELGECAAAASRCIIQGVDGAEPTTGKINKKWLEDEISDVYANCGLVIERFKLDTRAMSDRVLKKKKHLEAWHMKA